MSEHCPGEEQKGPLDGLVIVDTTRQMSGPYASMVLGDFGADIIKVESAPFGDPMRHVGNTFLGDDSTMFLTWNRNKRSVCIDLRSSDGVAVLNRLIDQADIVMENYRPGVADEIGFGADDVLRRNPRLIYCSVNAFGSVGPWSQRPGVDFIVQAMSGVMSVNGERDGGPLLVGIPIVDFSSANVAVQAILLALLARERTGRGQRIEVSMLHTTVAGLATRLGPFFATGENPTRWGSQHSQVVPNQVFETKDGYIAAGSWGDDGWGKFCEALDWPELAKDVRFDTNVKRVEHRDEVSTLIQERFLHRTTAEWDVRFSTRGVLFTPVNTFSDLFGHQQARTSGFVVEIDHPKAGSLKQITSPIQLFDTPASMRRPPPLLGQHTREVLLESGWTTEELLELLKNGVIIESLPENEREQ
jgi:crotonobetainyl-CoA:carnitine CoA-transferase CaiB-like acyl-CoA transferase